MSNIDCVNGDYYGPGIYLAVDAAKSLGYSHTVQNLYMNSMFGDEFTLIALCEVVPNKAYTNFGCFATLQDNDAIIVRFVFPVSKNNFDAQCSVYSMKEDMIPTIDNVLNYLEQKDYNKILYCLLCFSFC